MSRTPVHGDIINVLFDLVLGSEQQGRRLAQVCPIPQGGDDARTGS